MEGQQEEDQQQKQEQEEQQQQQNEEDQQQQDQQPQQRVICIGDIHGHYQKLISLWNNLLKHLGLEELDKAVIVILGDMCDRGPQTKEVLDWIINLKQERENKRLKKQQQEEGEKKKETRKEKKKRGRGNGKEKEKEKENDNGKRKWVEGEVVVLAGNHDMGMACYLGDNPWKEELPEEEIARTKYGTYTTGFYPYDVPGGMHYYGRRWGGSDTYNSSATFKSYGAEFKFTERARQELIARVPPAHHNFLKSMDMVYDIEVPWGKKRLICVHAGIPNIEKEEVEEYVQAMERWDILNDCLQPDTFGYLEPLSGRAQVILPPESLEKEAVIVSGHHSATRITEGRVVIDNSGGRFGIPLEAIIFPECELLCSGKCQVEKIAGIF